VINIVFTFSDRCFTSLMVSSILEMKVLNNCIQINRIIDERHNVTVLNYDDEKSCLKDYKKITKAWSNYVQRAAFGDIKDIGYLSPGDPDTGQSEGDEYEEVARNKLGFC